MTTIRVRKDKKAKTLKNLKFIVCCYFGAKQKTSRHIKIVNDEAIFVRYAVAESAAYLGVCEHFRRK